MSKKLIEQDFITAAKKLRCEVPAIKAVAEVESRGEGFYSDGFPVILFERHKFRQFTQGRYNATHPHLSGAQGNYGKAGQNQRNKFNEAFELNPIAAMKSCSWGKFQIMGFNHAVCGYATVGEFVDAMKESEGKQLLAFVNFVINNGLADELRNKNWAGFARGYNGTGYKKNNYDTKMASAYKKYQKLSAATFLTPKSENQTNSLIAATNSGASATEALSNNPTEGQTAQIMPPPETLQATEETQASTPEGETQIVKTLNEQDVNKPAEITEPEPYNGIGFWATIKGDLAKVGIGNGITQTASEYAQQANNAPSWIVPIIVKIAYVALIVGIGYLTFRVIHYLVDTYKKHQRTKLEVDAKTAVNRKDIQWTK